MDLVSEVKTIGAVASQMAKTPLIRFESPH